MRIDEECRDPDLLAAEVRRLRTVIAAGETTLTDEERAAVAQAADSYADYYDDPELMLVANTLRHLLERTK